MPWFLWLLLGIITGGLIVAVIVIIFILKIFEDLW
jgi:hypothetical protein